MENPGVERIKDVVDSASSNHQALPWFTTWMLFYFQQVPFLGTLVILMLIDVITGYIAAGRAKEVDSRKSLVGMKKKAQMLLMVAAGVTFELIYPDVPWGRLIAFFFCLTEFTSIIENAGRSGVYLPQQVKEAMKRLHADDKREPDVVVEIQSTHVEGEKPVESAEKDK